ncbi:hypothetical protein ACS8FB_01660 [Psychrobacter sp. 1U1]|uniref:hypothetical protein n=1 Tax=Psychrobacter sp. 1U1 TaxID=3453576 RepID=UPI003F45A603
MKSWLKGQKATKYQSQSGNLTGSPYSHCELVINELGEQRYDCISSSHRDGRLRRKTIYMEPSHWVLIPVMCDIDYAIRWFNKRKSLKYDYLALIRTIIPGFYNPEYRLFYSEACADMLELVDPASYGLKKLYRWAVDNQPLRSKPIKIVS